MRSSVWQVLKANVESVLLLANLEASTHVLICQAPYLKSFMKICKDWQRSQQLLGLHNIWLAAVPGKLEEWQTFDQVTWMWMGADPTSACPEARRRRRTEQGAMVLERTTSRTSHGYLDLGKHTDCGSFTLGFSLGVNIPHQFSCHGFQMFSLTYNSFAGVAQLLSWTTVAVCLESQGAQWTDWADQLMDCTNLMRFENPPPQPGTPVTTLILKHLKAIECQPVLGSNPSWHQS